jgi:pimeloyl-ACP methyl ester carboxylesterase
VPSPHSIRAALLALCAGIPLSTGAQQLPIPPTTLPPTASTFAVFFRGVPVGSEQVAVTRSASGWTILSTSRLSPPFDVVARRVQVRYTEEWKPTDLTIDAIVRGQTQALRTSVDQTTATSDITVNGQSTQKSDAVDGNVVLLPNMFFGPYEAIAERLKTASGGSSIPVYAAPQFSFTVMVGESSTEQIQTTARLIAAKRTRVTFATPTMPFDVEIWTDDAGRLLRVNVPSQNLDVVRDDIASVMARSVPISRPNDEQVKLPANGFSLAGTLSKPANADTRPLPAVVLIGGSGTADRDELVFGVPIFGQLAGAIADAGFVVLRYDKRGVGQSGGRLESASLADFADDLRAAVRFLSARKDIDRKRIAVVGHSEGGAVAMMAAAKDKRIAALVLVAANGVTGSDLVLAQQQHLLSRSNFSEAEKQAKIELQTRINQAVITGKGWETVPADLRRQADNPEFQSILTHDPAKIMPGIRQPILIVQGELDTQVVPSNADRLEALARARKKAPPPTLVKVPGVNHLLVPATTGEIEEYSTLSDKHVSMAVSSAIAGWLGKTLIAAR